LKKLPLSFNLVKQFFLLRGPCRWDDTDAMKEALVSVLEGVCKWEETLLRGICRWDDTDAVEEALVSVCKWEETRGMEQVGICEPMEG